MSNVTIQKREKYYQYKFEIAKVDGKRKTANKSGLKTIADAEREGINQAGSTKQRHITYVFDEYN